MGHTAMQYRVMVKREGNTWRPYNGRIEDRLQWLVDLELPRIKERNPEREFKIQERMVVYTEWDDVAE